MGSISPPQLMSSPTHLPTVLSWAPGPPGAHPDSKGHSCSSSASLSYVLFCICCRGRDVASYANCWLVSRQQVSGSLRQRSGLPVGVLLGVTWAKRGEKETTNQVPQGLRSEWWALHGMKHPQCTSCGWGAIGSSHGYVEFDKGNLKWNVSLRNDFLQIWRLHLWFLTRKEPED